MRTNVNIYNFRPKTNDRPSSETSLPDKKEAALCPRCFRPVSADFSNFDSAPFHEHSYLLMCRNMGKRDEMEKIAAKFGIRGSTFPPSARPAKSSIVHPGSYYSYNGVRMLTRQPRSVDGGAAPKKQSGRMHVRDTSALATNRQDEARRSSNQFGILRNPKTTEATGKELAATSNSDGYPEQKGAQQPGRKCTCMSGYIYDNKGDNLDRAPGMCSGHFCDFSYTSPVPVYISPKFMMQNPRERKHATGSRRHLSPAAESGKEKRPLSVSRHKKVPPINSQGGAIYINKDNPAHENTDHPANGVGKTTMDIYLPQLCMSQDSDDESVMTRNDQIERYDNVDHALDTADGTESNEDTKSYV